MFSLEMKVQNIYILIAVSCSFLPLVIIAWAYLNSLWLKPKRLEKYLRSIGFNGNSYRPWQGGDMKELGNMLQEALSKPINFSDDISLRVLPYFVETIKKYGKNSFVWRGPIPSVFIFDPALLKTVYLEHNIYQRPVGMSILLTRGLIQYDGKKWAKHRKIVTPAFNFEKIKHMLPTFDLCVSEMLSKWEAIISPEGSGELDISPYVNTLTGDVISRTAFGSNYEDGKNIFKLQKELTEHFTMLSNILHIPGARFLPFKRCRRMNHIRKIVNKTIRDIICKRLEAMKQGKTSNNDLLGMLLECNEQEIQEHIGDKSFGLTIQEVIDECRLFYLAGSESTAVLLAWALILLGRHQEWQSRAREEVLKHFGKNQPSFEGLNQLKIMPLILNETLRLYPPVVSVNRKIRGEAKVGEVPLPSGMMVTIPVLLLHRDTKIWGDDANEFKPERFAEGISKATKGKLVFLPFAWGPRICPGQNFSLVEAKLTLARILQSFSFELSPSYSHAPIDVVTLKPQHGAHLILHKLN